MPVRPFLPAALTATLLCLGAAADAVDTSQTRATWVTGQIAAKNATLSSTARAGKYALMAATPLQFYRGTDHLYWSDQGNSADLAPYGGTAATRIWLQGDCHIDNFGAFGNDNNTVVYDLNDFDESVIGDYQLDVWRCGVSIILVAREQGISAANATAALDAFNEQYLDSIEGYVGNNNETGQLYTSANTNGLLNNFLADTASNDSRKAMLNKWTVTKNGVRQMDTGGNAELAAVPAATVTAITNAMAAYGATLSGGVAYSSSVFKVKSIAQRLGAGIGSYGTTRYYVLIEGSSSGQDDDRILDVKIQGTPSAFGRYSSAAQAQTTAVFGTNPALRTVIAYKALGAHVDDFLGYLTLADGIYSVRELSPWKETFDTTTIKSSSDLTKMAVQWAEVLATAHCRADNDSGSSGITTSFESACKALINGNHAQFRARLDAKIPAYADQVDQDWQSFVVWYTTTGG